MFFGIDLTVMFFIAAGYLSGSVLYARVFGKLFHKDITGNSKDKNPGTANAFMEGGFWCGFFTLIFELLKGFIPVLLFRIALKDSECPAICFALVMAAPVLGHLYPIYFNFKGGKGIAVSFGSLLGLFPDLKPALLLAVFFIFFSLVLKVSPHFYRTIVTFICAAVSILFVKESVQVKAGTILISGLVVNKLHKSSEEREDMKVGWIWTH